MNTFFIYSGIAFWKTGSRKTFAVKKPLKKRKIKPSVDKITISGSDSDEYASDDQAQFSRKQRKASTTTSFQLSTIEGKLTEIQNVIDENKSELQKVLTFTKDSKVPIALKNIVKESFSCKICHKAPMETPILASRCCGCIIGCEVCVQTWYGTGSNVFDKCCPNCRADRGYSHTFRLVGIDEFLVKLQQLMISGDDRVINDEHLY
jgi:ACT domain-containing protein